MVHTSWLCFCFTHLHRTESVLVPIHPHSRRSFSAGQLGTGFRWRTWHHYVQHSGWFLILLVLSDYQTKKMAIVIFSIRGEWSLPFQFNNSPSARLGFYTTLQVLQNGDPFIILSVNVSQGELIIPNLDPDTEYTVSALSSMLLDQPPYKRLWLLHQVSDCQNTPSALLSFLKLPLL